MDKKLCETANLCLEIMKSKRQVKGKLKSATQPFVVSQGGALQDDTKNGCAD